MLKRAGDNGKRLNIITLVREPIAKNISQFFQNIEVSYPEFRYPEKVKTLSQEELIAEMVDFFIQSMHTKNKKKPTCLSCRPLKSC